MSYTFTTTSTFTFTNAKYLSSKVSADLCICNSYYGEPSLAHIDELNTEIAILLREDLLSTFEYGFEKDTKVVFCCKYTCEDSSLSSDDSPGKIFSRFNTSECDFYSFMCYTSKWNSLTETERAEIEAQIPIRRVTAPYPNYGFGYWSADKSYTSGNKSLARATFTII